MLAHGEFLAAPSWIQAGKAALGVGPDIPIVCLCSDPHHFYYMNDDRTFLGRDAIFVKKLKADDDVVATFSPYFDSFEAVDTLVIHRVSSKTEAVRRGDLPRARIQEGVSDRTAEVGRRRSERLVSAGPYGHDDDWRLFLRCSWTNLWTRY